MTSPDTPSLDHHSISADLAAFALSPLSRKRAMLLALLIDAEIDRRAGDDVLSFRAARAADSPALKIVMELCAMRTDGPRLIVEDVSFAATEAHGLREADYMVSLYNGGTVPRVRIGWDDGRREDALGTLRQAVAALER